MVYRHLNNLNEFIPKAFPHFFILKQEPRSAIASPLIKCLELLVEVNLRRCRLPTPSFSETVNNLGNGSNYKQWPVPYGDPSPLIESNEWQNHFEKLNLHKMFIQFVNVQRQSKYLSDESFSRRLY